MSSATFYAHEHKWLPAELPVPDELGLGVIEYLWTERSNASPQRLRLEHARQRKLVTRLCIALSATSILLGVAVWPHHDQNVTTQRVTMNECNGLLSIYGTRCH